MKKQLTTSLVQVVNSPTVKALIKIFVITQAIAPIVQMLAAVKTLLS